MTVKITKPAPPRHVTCEHCKTKVSFEATDVKSSGGYSYGEYDPSWYVKCPHCKGDIAVKP